MVDDGTALPARPHQQIVGRYASVHFDNAELIPHALPEKNGLLPGGIDEVVNVSSETINRHHTLSRVLTVARYLV